MDDVIRETSLDVYSDGHGLSFKPDGTAILKPLSLRQKWDLFVEKLETTGSISTAMNLATMTKEEIDKIINMHPQVGLILNQIKYKFKEEIVLNLKTASENGNYNASVYLLEKHFKEDEEQSEKDDDFDYNAQRFLNGNKD